MNNEYDKYLKTYNPLDIPDEIIRQEAIQIMNDITTAFFKYISNSMNVKFNWEIMQEPVIIRNNETITYNNSYVTQIPPNYLEEQGQMVEISNGEKVKIYSFFDHILTTLNEQHNRMYGKYKFLIYAISITPVMMDQSGSPVRGVFFQYVPYQHVA